MTDNKNDNKIVKLDTGFVPVPDDVKKRMMEQRKKMDTKARIDFIEHYIDGIRDDLIESYAANGIDIFSEAGINDVSFLVEAHNAFLHRRMGLKHFMDDFIDKVIKFSKDKG